MRSLVLGIVLIFLLISIGIVGAQIYSPDITFVCNDKKCAKSTISISTTENYGKKYIKINDWTYSFQLIGFAKCANGKLGALLTIDGSRTREPVWCQDSNYSFAGLNFYVVKVEPLTNQTLPEWEEYPAYMYNVSVTLTIQETCPQDCQKGNLTVVVFDNTTGKFVERAYVYISDLSGRLVAEGGSGSTFYDIPVGTYIAQTRAEGYYMNETKFEVQVGANRATIYIAPTEVQTLICIAKIDAVFSKSVYYADEVLTLKVGIWDANGNLIPYKSFKLEIFNGTNSSTGTDITDQYGNYYREGNISQLFISLPAKLIYTFTPIDSDIAQGCPKVSDIETITILPSPAVIGNCTDTDSDNIFTQGIVYGQNPSFWNGASFRFTDRCYTNTSVFEQLCTTDNLPVEKIMICPANYTCENGACVFTGEQPPAPPETGIQNFTLNLYRGWNMLSGPLVYRGEILRGYFPVGALISDTNCNFESQLWHYNVFGTKGYIAFGTPAIGQSIADHIGGYIPAYWLKVANDCSITFTGLPFNYGEVVNLAEGWNQIGIGSYSTTWDNIKGNCELLSGPWEWNAANQNYVKATILEPGKGYWVKLKEACTTGKVPVLPPSPPTGYIIIK
jgi:hypothetical protein